MKARILAKSRIMAMDDFKASTRKMLEVVRGERARLQARINELNDREKTILGWIEAEEGPQQELPMEQRPVTLVVPRRQKPTMQELFREVMREGKAVTNADLKEIGVLRGILDENTDLRSVHSTMMSLMNAGEVTRREDKWIRKV